MSGPVGVAQAPWQYPAFWPHYGKFQVTATAEFLSPRLPPILLRWDSSEPSPEMAVAGLNAPVRSIGRLRVLSFFTLNRPGARMVSQPASAGRLTVILKSMVIGGCD